MLRQRTLGQPVSATGVGLHSGESVELTLLPAPANAGVVFRRVDLCPVVEIPARASAVTDTTLCTCLQADGQRVATVEHLLGALAGLGIDNVYADVTAAEVPIMDGSAGPFVQMLGRAGVSEQDAPKRFVRIKRQVSVEQGDRTARFIPFEGCKISFTVDFDLPVVRGRNAHVDLDFSRRSFVEEISRARTFGFVKDVEQLHARGLALGGSLENAVLLDDNAVLNPGGLRFDDELVKHKALDALGDLYLLGAALIGEFRAYKSGHRLNHALVKALLAEPGAWELVHCEAGDTAPVTADMVCA